MLNFFVQLSLRRKCRCSEFFSSIFFRSGLNMDTYSESLCIYLECGKMRTRKILSTDTFNVVCLSKKSFNEKSTLNAQFRSSTAGIYLFKVNNWNIRAIISDSRHYCGVSIVEKLSIIVLFLSGIALLCKKLVTRKVRPWMKLTLTLKKYFMIFLTIMMITIEIMFVTSSFIHNSVSQELRLPRTKTPQS